MLPSKERFARRDYGNFSERAPLGQASTQAMQRIHSESLNFFQSRSRIGTCIGHASWHSLQSAHLTGSLCMPSRLFFCNTAIIAPTGQTYLHQKRGTCQAAKKNPARMMMFTHVRTGTLER